MTDETPAHRLKRMKMRAWRRGMREMDLILGPFAEARLDQMPGDELDRFDALLNENDHDLLGWITGTKAPDIQFSNLIGRVRDYVKPIDKN